MHDFGIQKGDKVLDIGCGSCPFPLATHLADISIEDNSARFGQPIPVNGLPFYECSVMSMPFANKEFDFIYCMHVLEHVDDPVIACNEIMRVGKRGYIECPRSWVEYAFYSVDHRWLVDFENNTLIFRELLDEEKRDHLGIQYSIFDWIKEPDFVRYWESPRFKPVRTVQLYWENSFRYYVIPKQQRNNAGAYPQFYSPDRGQNGARPDKG